MFSFSFSSIAFVTLWQSLTWRSRPYSTDTGMYSMSFLFLSVERGVMTLEEFFDNRNLFEADFSMMRAVLPWVSRQYRLLFSYCKGTSKWRRRPKTVYLSAGARYSTWQKDSLILRRYGAEKLNWYSKKTLIVSTCLTALCLSATCLLAWY